MAAFAVPPVASRSSTMIILSPGLTVCLGKYTITSEFLLNQFRIQGHKYKQLHLQVVFPSFGMGRRAC